LATHQNTRCFRQTSKIKNRKSFISIFTICSYLLPSRCFSHRVEVPSPMLTLCIASYTITPPLFGGRKGHIHHRTHNTYAQLNLFITYYQSSRQEKSLFLKEKSRIRYRESGIEHRVPSIGHFSIKTADTLEQKSNFSKKF